MTKLLLVEDSRGDARLFAELLRDVPGQPFSLTTTATLADALPIAGAHDVVFLDLSLPDAHGLDALKALSASAATPIVVLTGNDDDALAVQAVAAGAQDYVKKGDVSAALIARVAWYAIERRKSEEQRRRLAISERATRRAKLMSGVSAALAASFDLEVTLPVVARLLAAELADVCVIDLVRDDGGFTRVAAEAADPQQKHLLSCASEYAPAPLNPRSPALRVVETREPIEIPLIDLASYASDARTRSIAEQLGARSMLTVPLLARDRALGAVTMTLGRSGRVLDDDLRQLAADAAEHIAMGIDNSLHYAAAQRAIRARDELIAVVSHDLRNPLGVISLSLQMMEHEPTSVASTLPRAQRAADRMLRLIEDLLDIARIDSGTLRVELEPVEIGVFIDEAWEHHRALAAAKNISLVRRVDGAVGSALADKNRLLQAVGNLLGNALKFTPARGTITLDASRRGDQVVIAVSDSGVGIAAEHLAHIFDRYWQRDRNQGGIGLGLAIVKGIVDAHGGTIEVTSTPGRGTTFSIVLPSVMTARPPSGPTDATHDAAALQ